MACPLLAWERAEKIQGWLERLEAMSLHMLCEGPWCEVGSWKGRSTVMLAETGHPGYAVDWFRGTAGEHDPETDTYAEFIRNVSGYENLTVLRGRYEDMADLVPNGLRLLYLDADHSLEETKRAFDLYSPKLEVGGILALHDAAGGGYPHLEGFARHLLEMAWRPLVTAERLVALRCP